MFSASHAAAAGHSADDGMALQELAARVLAERQKKVATVKDSDECIFRVRAKNDR